jgi:hypothetical protein
VHWSREDESRCACGSRRSQLRDGPPLWIGTTQRLHHSSADAVLRSGVPVADDGSATPAVRADLSGMTAAEEVHPATSLPVLRVRAP